MVIYFKLHHIIEYFQIVQDENGKSKDYSFVHFEIEEADKAIEKANGSF